MRLSITSVGFTLIELAVIIVIIGMIISGILFGQNLIGRAHVAGVMQEVEHYRSAFFKFREKYQQLPGDMVDAYNQLAGGVTTRCGNNGYITASVNNCNGNGDGRINFSSTNGYAETLRGWQHLQAAGFVEGVFGGVAVSSVRYIPDVNIPFSRLNNGAGYDLFTNDTADANHNAYGVWAHMLRLAKSDSNTTLRGGAITVDDALAIDQKLDDGIANTGEVLAQDGTDSTVCVSDTDVYVLDADIHENLEVCSLTFVVEYLN